ncbi:MAG: hypothetical protein C0615_04745 [Desulfuromonas sp.]|nr:MAG: hypothetical protein C0615_04745 [Desulfuromonas sp.]
MRAKFFLTLILMLALTACGPMFGSMMLKSNGVKDFKVVTGQLSDLKPGSKVLVIAPFTITAESFYICRGEDATMFVDEFNKSGLFMADYHMADQFGDNTALIKRLKGESPMQIQTELGLAEAPDYLVTGTIMKRETVAAPTKGVLMRATYRLEFTNLSNSKKTILEINAQELFQDTIPAVVKDLVKRMTGR